jgi:hypothetical protein
MNPIIPFLMWSLPFVIPMSNGASGTPVPRPAARVKIEISAADQIKYAMHSHIAQSFQSLGGVQLVEADPQWVIKIVTLAVQDTQGNTTALGVSVVVLERGPQMDMLRTLTQAWRYIIRAGLLQKDQPLEVGLRQLIAGIDQLPDTDDLGTLSQHKMSLIAMNKLPGTCHEIASDFHARFLGSR